jgi:chloramphenicol 3-O-phosphotransferase
VPGAGKTTVSRLVAAGLPRSALIHGDDIHNLVVSRRRHPQEEPAEEADRQLELRDRNISALVDNLAEAGFLPIVDDVVVYRSRLTRLSDGMKARPIYMAVLAPDLEIVRTRDGARPDKSVFHLWSHLDNVMRQEIMGIGCWIDSSQQTPAETAAEVMQRVWNEGLIV